MLLAANDPEAEEHTTCEVIFVDDFETGAILEVEGFDPPQANIPYVKPDLFFSFELYAEDGVVKVDGRPIGKAGRHLRTVTYLNGPVLKVYEDQADQKAEELTGEDSPLQSLFGLGQSRFSGGNPTLLKSMRSSGCCPVRRIAPLFFFAYVPFGPSKPVDLSMLSEGLKQAIDEPVFAIRYDLPFTDTAFETGVFLSLSYRSSRSGPFGSIFKSRLSIANAL